jgi:hypothetical protein
MEQEQLETVAASSCCSAKVEISPIASCCATPSPAREQKGFWIDLTIWKRAAKNTLNCLVGCSLGDFGTLIAFQHFAPHTPMFTVMGIAILAGLTTSILLETTLLRIREHFSWAMAFKTAFSMSFLSMVAMELAENATDFMLTGGNISISQPFYWVALGVALLAGFAVPLPYNYYQLKKHGKACH